MEKATFYIFKRQPRVKAGRPKRRPTFYCQFRNSDGGMSSAISTGQHTRAAAQTWVANFIKKGGSLPSKSHMTFGEFALPWWGPNCPYVRAKRARGYSISDAYIDFRRNNLRLHVLPVFGEIPLVDITPRMIEEWVLGWYEKKTSAPATINRSLGTLKLMLKEAVRLGYLNGNPASAVEDLKETPAERGILSFDEMQRLFAAATVNQVWCSRYHFAANFLAAQTGARLGEIQALQRQYVHDQYIEIRHSWSDKYKLLPPKWHSVRPCVPIGTWVSVALQDVMEANPYKAPDTLVFAASRPDKPLSKTAILEQYRHALEKIGIDVPTQKQRGLCFHSWRHGYNSVMRGLVGDEMTRRVLGHKSPEMTNNYDHVSLELMAPVRAALEKMNLGGTING